MSYVKNRFSIDRYCRSSFADRMCHRLRRGYGIISLILLQLTAFTATLGAGQSPWSSSSSLGWGDFLGTPPALSSDPADNFDAFVYTEILWDFTWDVSTRTLVVNVQAVFDHSVSWYRPSEATPALLVHEVAHFDYAEIHARKLKRRIDESVELKELLRRCDVSESEIEAMLTLFHSEEIDELIFSNEFYDSETDHGQITAMQNVFTNVTIPDEMSSVSAFANPEITITVQNEGAKPIPGYYEGSLTYTLQGGSPGSSPSAWEWTLQGQWHFAFTSDDLGGEADWSHWITNNLYGGHLVDVTTPNVPSYPAVDVSVEADASGEHFWMDFSGAAPSSIPSHELTFSPVSVPGIPVTPDNKTIHFNNGAAIALGHWMKEYGTPSLKMKAPITCPNESIHYEFPIGTDQFLVMDWVLTRISDAQGGSGAGGSGSGGIGTGSLPVSAVAFDSSTGVLILHWDASAAGELFVIEASADLEDWIEVGEVVSASPGVVTFQFDTSPSTTSSQFFRILPGGN